MKTTNLNVDLQFLLNQYTEKLKKTFNCIQVGEIVKFYPEDKTADVNICFKKQVAEDIINYPLLLKCPVLGNKITTPIEEGEFCIVLFNDVNIDGWFETGQAQKPYSNEKHCISDGLVICGLNALSNAINYDNENINLTYKSNIKVGENLQFTTDNSYNINSKDFNVSITAGGNINIDETGLIAIKNNQQSLFTLLNTLLTALLSLKTGPNPATATYVLDQQTTETLTTLQTNLALLLKA